MDNVLVSSLREITEDGDLKSMLKGNLGGYTKKSVQDYLAYVKKQQQSLKDTYSAEISRLQEDNESLRAEKLRLERENAELAERLSGSDRAREAMAAEERNRLEESLSAAACRIEGLTEELSIRERSEKELKAATEALSRREAAASGMAERLQQELEKLRTELECSAAENSTMAERLQNREEESIGLCRENSRLKSAYAILQRRYESAFGNRQLAMMGIDENTGDAQ